MQCTTVQVAQPQRVARAQLPRGIAERPRPGAIEMKLQPGIVAGKAGQRIRPSDAGTGPQQQVLTCTIAQRPLRQQTQAQHAAAQPLGALHLSGQSVAAGIEDFYTEILLDTALDRKSTRLNSSH